MIAPVINSTYLSIKYLCNLLTWRRQSRYLAAFLVRSEDGLEPANGLPTCRWEGSLFYAQFRPIIISIKVAIVPVFPFYVALLKGVSSGYRWLFGLSDVILAKRRAS